MEFHTFGPGLALDPLTMRGVPAMTVYLEDADTGDPVQAYTMDADPAETTVRTNRFGYFPQFQVSAEVRRLRIVVGEVEMIHGAWELIYTAEASAADTLTAAQAAQAAAEHAASLVEAPADIKVAELIRNEGTATQRILHGLYGARGNTFVQPTAPPAGTTYEWAGEKNNSESIKKIDGTETARNLIPDPKLVGPNSFTSTANTTAGKVPRGELFTELGDRIGDEVFAFEAIDENGGSVYTALTQENSPTLQEGKWYAGHIWTKTIPDLVAPYRFNLQFRNSAHTTFSSDLVETFPSGTSKVRVVGQMENEAMTWWVFWPFDLRRFPGEKIYIGAVILSGPADTEHEAIQAATDYFDGDMPDDRANDVWFNTTDNREYIWDTETHEWKLKPALDDAGIAALIEDTSSETRQALNTRFAAAAQDTADQFAAAARETADQFTAAEETAKTRHQRERKLSDQTDMVELLRHRSNLGHIHLRVTGTGTHPSFSVYRVYDGGTSGFYTETSFAGGSLTSNDQYQRIWENRFGSARATSTPGEFTYTDRGALSPASNHEFALRIKPASHPNESTQWVPRHNNIDTAFRAADPLFMTPNGRLRVLEGDVTSTAVDGHLDIIQTIYGRHPATGSTNLIQVWTTHRFYPDGTIHLSGRWKALEDIIMDSGYVLMFPGNPAYVTRVVSSLGNTYTSEAAKYGTSDALTEETDQAKSYGFVTVGASNFAAAVTYDNIHETLRRDDQAKPEDPAFIEHRNSGILKIYNQLVDGETLIPAGTVHRFAGRYAYAYSPLINDTIDTI